MTTLTLIYAADSDGNFTDPKTKKCWNVDRDFFRETIKDKAIICGRKTFEKDYKGFLGCKDAVILGNVIKMKTRNALLRKFRKDFIDTGYMRDLPMARDISEALYLSKRVAAFPYEFLKEREDEVFCVGGKQTIEAFAPFASKILLTHIGESYYPWLPPYVQDECNVVADDPYCTGTLWKYNIVDQVNGNWWDFYSNSSIPHIFENGVTHLEFRRYPLMSF